MTDDAGPVPEARLVDIVPRIVVAGSTVSLRLRFEVGRTGLPAGTELLIELPPSWYTDRQSYAKPVHSTDPMAVNYVSASIPGKAVELQCVVEGGTTQPIVLAARPGIDGARRRYMYVTRVWADLDIPPGEMVEVVYGDTRGGSPGFAAPRFANGPERPVVAVRSPGGTTRLDTGLASVEVVPDARHELLAVAPSIMVVGQQGELTISAVDRHGNPLRSANDPPTCRLHTGDAALGDLAPWQTHHASGWRLPFRVLGEGPLRIEVRAGDLVTISNPVLCRPEPPTSGLFWGDLHSHAADSFDAIGAFPYEYAREVARLDFYALTEHCEYVDEVAWTRLVAQADALGEDGKFVTFPAYEATFGEPWGHHNVFFRDATSVVSPVGAHNGTLPELWDAIRGQHAFTVPHHTGIAFSSSVAGEHDPLPNPDWSYHDAVLRPVIEIYSAHGSSERFDPTHPLAYDNADHSISTSREGPFYAWDAWRAGLRLGVIGSSDDHMGQPGRGEYGLAAVVSPSLTRDGIFDGLLMARSYATTGARMIIEMSVDGVSMGGHVAASDHHTVSVRVLGTGSIDRVELVALDGKDAQPSVVHVWQPDAWDMTASWDDPDPGRRMWYVRVVQQLPYRGRLVMGWTSPVWVTPAGQ